MAMRIEKITNPATGKEETRRYRWHNGGFSLIDDRTDREKTLHQINLLAQQIERAFTAAARHDERATDADRDRRAKLAANARQKARRAMQQRDALIAKFGNPNP